MRKFLITYLAVIFTLGVVTFAQNSIGETRDSARKIGLSGADDIKSFANLSTKLGKNGDELAGALASGKGKIGIEFEEHLAGKLGGQGSFKVGGREFDGKVGDAWYEAKSGRYWDDIYKSNPNKFKEDMGSRLRIASDNGASYHLISNTPIPADAKAWLTKKGITYVDISN